MSDDNSHSSLIEQLSNHLEFLGFKITPPSEGDHWHWAEHTRRIDIFFRAFPEFLRLHSNHYLGVCPNDHARDTALHQLNDLNELTQITKFCLTKSDKADKIDIVRIRAHLPATYDRPLFGSLLDLWQKESDMVWRVDRYPPHKQTIEDENNADTDSTTNTTWAEDQNDSH